MAEDTLLNDATTGAKQLVYQHIPGYARFLREHYLIPYIQEQIRLSKEVKLPMLKFFSGMTDEELLNMSVASTTKFLVNAEENRLREQFEQSLEIWASDQLGIIRRHEVTAQDITLASYIRKKAMLKYLPSYTSDVAEAIEIIKELDSYATETDAAAMNLYIKLLKDRINEQAIFAEIIATTTPGLYYVFDTARGRISYVNDNYLKYSGYSLQELSDRGPAIIGLLVHPDDVAATEEGMLQCSNAGDGEVVKWEYRLKSKDGEYHWMRNYSSVFKRNDESIPTEIVGIILNIDTEKETADKLQESDLLFRQAQELSHIGNWTWDLKTGKIKWSDELYHIYGLTPGLSLTFDDITSFNSEEENLKIKKNLKDAKETLAPTDTYFHITLRDGTMKVLHAKSETITETGAASKMIGTIQDVTEKQLLLERLQESETLNKQAQAISHMGNWIWSFDTKKLTWSEELYRIYELEPFSVDTSATLAKYNHPDDQKLVSDTIRQAIETLSPFEFDYRIVLDNGKTKMLNARGEVKREADGRSLKIYGTVQDITVQKTIERQLQEYQEFIEKITDITPSIIAAYNIHTGQYSFINDAIDKLLGYSPTLIMEHGAAFVMSIIHPDDMQGLTEKNAKALEDANAMKNRDNEPIAEFKYRMKNSKGEYRWFHTYGTIFERNSAGQVESVLNISVDVTEQEMAEQALYQKNLLLQQSNTSLEEYAYVASHDLKEPLRKITTYSDRILSSQYNELSEESRTFFDKIISAATRMQKMINDLLSVSTILGNTEFEQSDLNALLADATAPLDHKIEESGAIIEAATLPTVYVVPSQFRQLFQNLIGNSLKFARPGIAPHITITSKFVHGKIAERYELAKAKKYLQIEIEDNGIGFDNQYAGKIFAIFQRLHGKTEYEGTGIGLAICKKIVENHGGTIFAKGTAGEGAVFTIIIPAR